MEIGTIIEIGDRPPEPFVMPIKQPEPVEPIKVPSKEKEKT